MLQIKVSRTDIDDIIDSLSECAAEIRADLADYSSLYSSEERKDMRARVRRMERIAGDLNKVRHNA